MVGTAGGRRVVLALAFCGAGYLAVSLLRIGRDPADSAGFFGDLDPVEESRQQELTAADPDGALARVASTVVLETQAFASVRLRAVDAGRAPVSGIQARLEGKPDGKDDFRATTRSDGQGLLAFENVADACPLSLVVAGEDAWVAQTLTLAPLSAGEVRDLGECVLQRGLVVTGFVVDEQGATVAGARVKLSQPTSPLERRMNLGLAETETGTTLTSGVDDQGRFRFEGVAGGTYVLEAGAPGFLGGRIEPLRVPDHAGEDLELRLERGIVVRGRVVGEDGLPLTDARVARIASTLALSAKTRQQIAEEDGIAVDAEGRFQLGGLRAEESAFLLALAPQRVARVLALAVTPVEATHMLPGAHVLDARILDHEGKPAPEAFARIESIRYEPPADAWSDLVYDRETRADERGHLALEGLARGEYRLVVSSAAGHLERDVSVPCPPLELSLPPAEALTVRVVDAGGRPVPGLRVELTLPTFNDAAAPSGDRVLRARTDDEGQALFRDLLRGFWSVRVLRGGATLVEDMLEVAGLPATVEYTALDPGSLLVQVVDGAGKAIQGVSVRLAREGRAGARRAAVPGGQDKLTDAFGRAAWIGVAPGDYLVSFVPRDLGQLLGIGARVRAHGSRVLVHLLPGTALGTTLTLAEPSLRVQVTRDGEPVARAQVSYCAAEESADLLTAMALGLPVAQTTDDGGWAGLVVPDPGEYEVRVRPSLMSPLTRRLCRIGTGTETMVVELEGGLVSGTCRSQGAAPVYRAQVHLIPAPEGPDPGTVLLNVSSPVLSTDDSPGKALRVHLGETTTFSDSFGAFRFDDVPAGVYHLQVSHPSFATWSSNPFPVAQDAAVDLGELALEPTCSLQGHIDYGPWAEAAKEHPVVVRLLTREQENVGMSSAGEDGRFEFTSLAPGLYQLAVDGNDFSHSGEVFEISAEKANYQSINISN